MGSGLGGKAGPRGVGKIKLEEMASTSKSLHGTSIQMGGAWRAVLGKVHLRECWRKAGVWNAYSHLPDDDEPVPGDHR